MCTVTLAVDEAELVAARRGAGAAAGGQVVAGAALPDLDADVLPGEDLQNWTLVFFGNRVRLEVGPYLCASSGEFSGSGITQCGLPMEAAQK